MPDAAAVARPDLLKRWREASDVRSLRRHIAALDDAGLLQVVDRAVDKDQVMHPLVRWQYRGGIPEADRKAFLFTQPVDAKGRHYAGAVLIGGLAANAAVYRLGFGPGFDEMGATWRNAIANPLPPRLVASAVCQQVVRRGTDLDVEGQGLDSLPVPVSTPGWDNAPYISGGHFITRDPETGVVNVGTYRGQLKGRRRVGMNASVDFQQGIYQHWLKYRARGEPMPCCIAIGCPPAVSYAAGYKAPDDMDELALAGALCGEPIDIVRAVSVDLYVPALSEIVIEGFVSTRELEPEGPFGESHGHLNLQEFNAFMDVTAITHRDDPILLSIISQVAPSESSTIRRAAMEPDLLQGLVDAGASHLKRVHMHEPLSSVLAIFVLQFSRGAPQSEVWSALDGAARRFRFGGRWIIAVDEDIDPANNDAIFWALAYRSQPQFELRLVEGKEAGHGPKHLRDNGMLASVLINATLKSPFPPVALPTRAFMEQARQVWEELGLPKIAPEWPWYGEDLGAWTADYARQAEFATRGDWQMLGDLLLRHRRSDVEMNTSFDGSITGN